MLLIYYTVTFFGAQGIPAETYTFKRGFGHVFLHDSTADSSSVLKNASDFRFAQRLASAVKTMGVEVPSPQRPWFFYPFFFRQSFSCFRCAR